MSQPEYFEGEKVVFQKSDLKRARLVAIFLSVATFVAIISFVFARIQMAQAEEMREQAEQLRAQLIEQTEIARQNAMEAEKQHGIAMQAKEEADRQRALAIATESAANQVRLDLAKCKKSK